MPPQPTATVHHPKTAKTVIAQLTSDIVWLVEQTVTLPDGTTQQVLVTQVYVVPRQGDLKGDGTLLAGNTVRLAASGDFSNSGTVAGRNLVDLSAENTGDQGLLLAIAGRDINLTAAEVSNTHGDSQLLDGCDLNLDTLTLSQQSDIRYSPGNTAKFGASIKIATTTEE